MVLQIVPCRRLNGFKIAGGLVAMLADLAQRLDVADRRDPNSRRQVHFHRFCTVGLNLFLLNVISDCFETVTS